MKKEIFSAYDLKEKAKLLLENFLKTQKVLTRVGIKDLIPIAALRPKLPLDKFLDFIKKQEQMAKEILAEAKENARKGPKESRPFCKSLESWLESLMECYQGLVQIIDAKKKRVVDSRSVSATVYNRILKDQEGRIKKMYALAVPMNQTYGEAISKSNE